MLNVGVGLKQAREKLGWNQTKLATRAGTTPPTVSRIENGEVHPRQETLIRLLGAMGMSLESFYSGLSTSNVEHAEIGSRRIPVLDYIQAGKWTGVDARFLDENVTEYIFTDVEYPESTFAMTIRGDSMQPLFREGDKVVISRALQPRPGDYVVASEDSGEGTFKQYRSLGKNDNGHDVFELVPLNTLYAPMRSDRHNIAIVGVMVEHRRYRHL